MAIGLQGNMIQGYRVIGLQGYSTMGLDYRVVTAMQGFRVAGLCDYTARVGL